MVPYRMDCPRCGKRACDISADSNIENSNIYVELKCPNCRNIVRIQFYKNGLNERTVKMQQST